MTLARCRGQRRNSLTGLISALVLAPMHHLAAQTISVIDSARDHPAPGTTLTRFEKIDDGVYKGSEPKNDADYQFLQSKQIQYITRDAFSPPGFPARLWAVLLLFFSPQQTLVELPLISAVVAVEKWKAFCAFQAQRLFHGHQAAARCWSG